MAKTKTLDDFLREYYLFPDQAFSINERKAVESYVAYREQQATEKAFEEAIKTLRKLFDSLIEKQRHDGNDDYTTGKIDGLEYGMAVMWEYINPYKTDNNENAG